MYPRGCVAAGSCRPSLDGTLLPIFPPEHPWEPQQQGLQAAAGAPGPHRDAGLAGVPAKLEQQRAGHLLLGHDL